MIEVTSTTGVTPDWNLENWLLRPRHIDDSTLQDP